jgi:hypothetical protein
MMDQPLEVALIAALAVASGAAGTWLAIHWHALLGAWRLGRQHRPPPIEVLVGDGRQRRELERALRAAIRQLDGATAVSAPASALVVQRIVWDGWDGDGGRQIHGCARRPARFAADPRPRLCLALEVDGRALPLDEILATLAELWTLHLKGDDRDFVPIVLGTATTPRRPGGVTASRRAVPLSLPTDE